MGCTGMGARPRGWGGGGGQQQLARLHQLGRGLGGGFGGPQLVAILHQLGGGYPPSMGGGSRCLSRVGLGSTGCWAGPGSLGAELGLNIWVQAKILKEARDRNIVQAGLAALLLSLLFLPAGPYAPGLLPSQLSSCPPF